jgi:hypothetical protein
VEIRKALAPYLARHVAIDLPWKLRDGIGNYQGGATR